MTTMRFIEVNNVYGEIYNIIIRKHSEAEILNDYGYPYSIKIKNANPKAFDLNNHIFLYDDWQTAYKRAKEFTKEYKEIEPLIIDGVDGETGHSITT